MVSAVVGRCQPAMRDCVKSAMIKVYNNQLMRICEYFPAILQNLPGLKKSRGCFFLDTCGVAAVITDCSSLGRHRTEIGEVYILVNKADDGSSVRIPTGVGDPAFGDYRRLVYLSSH